MRLLGETYEAMGAAFAKGEFFNRHVRHGYQFTREADQTERTTKTVTVEW